MELVAKWFPYLALAALVLAVIGLILASVLYGRLKALRVRLDEFASANESRQAQMQIMHESILEMGRHIISLDARVNHLRQTQPTHRPVQSDQTNAVIEQLQAGRSVEQIAAATGLDEVEISLLKEIHGARGLSAEGSKSPATQASE